MLQMPLTGTCTGTGTSTATLLSNVVPSLQALTKHPPNALCHCVANKYKGCFCTGQMIEAAVLSSRSGNNNSTPERGHKRLVGTCRYPDGGLYLCLGPFFCLFPSPVPVPSPFLSPFSRVPYHGPSADPSPCPSLFLCPCHGLASDARGRHCAACGDPWKLTGTCACIKQKSLLIIHGPLLAAAKSFPAIFMTSNLPPSN